MSQSSNETMSEWIKLERLPGNDLPLPKYETPMSAGIDFAVCLKRPCFKIGESKSKSPFIPTKYGENPLRKDLSSEQIDLWKTDGVYDSDPHRLDELGEQTQILMNPGEVIMMPLGFKSEFGNHYVLHIHVRSSVGLMGLTLANGTGIVDPDYRGELFAVLFNRSQYIIPVTHGDRVVQGVLLRFEQAIIQEEKVDDTERGEGGFGSTGLKTN